MPVPATPVSDPTPWGPTGKIVFDRTYSRDKAAGGKETWPETVERVVDGNLALVYGRDKGKWDGTVWGEHDGLVRYMSQFALIPAGRHLWATGVEGRQYLSNCHQGHWTDDLSEHFEFSFLRLMEGGGVGANYSSRYTGRYGAPKRRLETHVICDPGHEDYQELAPSLSRSFDSSAYGWFVEDSREGWAVALTGLIGAFYSDDPATDEIQVYDVSKVRPSGSELKTFGGTASGPAPFARMMLEVTGILNRSFDKGAFTPLDAMEIDHAIAECVVSGGNRRSARMSIVHWNDPYILDFINCKANTGKHWTTNISVEIDDTFNASLRHDGRARQVHEAVVKGMLANGEPGYWNSSLSNKGETGEVVSTNPCGEIPMEPWDVCNLGHVNMDWFADKDMAQLTEAHTLMTRFLMRATFSDFNDPRQHATVLRNRRIGVGHLGVQGYWAKRGVKYSQIPDVASAELKALYRVVRDEARRYAFQLRIPEPVKVTTVAPTGSVAKLPGVSEGIHPIYARWFERRVRFSKRDDAQLRTVLAAIAEGFTVEDDVYDSSGMTAVVVYPTEDILMGQVRDAGFRDSVVQSADEVSVRDMLRVQHLYQRDWADNAVSYTVNVPEGKLGAEELGSLLAEFLPVLKGTTVMVDASRPQAPYTRITRGQYEAAAAKRAEDSTDLECKSGACPVR